MSEEPRIEITTDGKRVKYEVFGELPKVDWEIDKDFTPDDKYKPIPSNKNQGGAE